MPRRRRRPPLLPWLVFLGGVVFSLSLQAAIPDEVFLNGDVGLKAVMTRQLASGDLGLDLRLPAEGWVRALWQGGLYPFEPPFVYERTQKYFIRFTLPFLLVNAPLYRAFGYRGLYVIPLLATWMTWVVFLRAGRALRLRPSVRAAALAILIFATPLTLYSAAYWEHTLAVALAFAGLALVLLRPFARPPSGPQAIAGGALLGASVCFREEHLFLAGLLAGLSVLASWIHWPALRPLRDARKPLLAGLLLAVLPFLAFNTVGYGQPLGLHAVYALETFSWTDWGPAAQALRETSRRLLEHFPAAVLCPLALWPGLARRFPGLRRAPLLLLLAAAFALGVPVLLHTDGGKEMGPRFLLVMMPLLALVLGLLLEAARRVEGRAAGAVLLLSVAFFAARGAWVDTWREAGNLRRVYQRKLAPYRFVRSDPAAYVAVSHQFVSQALVGTFADKTFFMAKRGRDLRSLGRELARHGERRFLYVCYPAYPCGPVGEQTPEITLPGLDGGPALRLASLGTFDRYLIYEATLLPDP